MNREAHDVFICTKGSLQVWAGEKSRVLYPGDVASVPPVLSIHLPFDQGSDFGKGTRHSFHLLQAQTEFLGLVVPGNWIK
jgi:hypothetical protein